jgi:hypothetical protein
MPSSGYGAVELIPSPSGNPETMVEEGAEWSAKALRLCERAKHAMEQGLFVEWLESFVAAWEQTKDVDIASWAGLEEWDM